MYVHIFDYFSIYWSDTSLPVRTQPMKETRCALLSITTPVSLLENECSKGTARANELGSCQSYIPYAIHEFMNSSKNLKIH